MIEPSIHDDVRRRHGHGTGDEDQLDEVFREQRYQAADGGAEDFADADLLGPLLGGEGGQAEEARREKVPKTRASRSSVRYWAARSSARKAYAKGRSENRSQVPRRAARVPASRSSPGRESGGVTRTAT